VRLQKRTTLIPALLQGIVLTFTMLHAFPAPLQSESPEQILTRALQLHRDGDLAGAIEAYKSLLEYGKHPDILTNLGAAHAGTGDFGTAIRYYREALEVDPEHEAARMNLGIACYKTALAEEAITQFKWILERAPGNEQAAFLLADCHFRLGHNEDVVAVLTPFESRAGENLGIAYLLGTSLIRTGRVEDGQRYVELILRRGESAEAHLMMATAQRIAGDVPKAIDEVNQAIALNPTLPGSHSLLGQLYLAVDGQDQIRRNPNLLGEVRLEGINERAIQAFEAEIGINPNDFDSHFFLGYILKENEKYDEALPHLERALLLRPGAYHVAYHIGMLWMLKGQPDKAREVLTRVTEEEPEFIEAHVALATACYRLQLKEEGDRHREIVVRLTAQKAQ